jgi:hypothetical protein
LQICQGGYSFAYTFGYSNNKILNGLADFFSKP